MVIEFDICHLFSWCYTKIYHSTKFIDLFITKFSGINLESRSIFEANTIEEKSINKDLPKWYWIFAFWSSRPIVIKKIGFSQNFGQLSWALIFFSPPPIHNLWKPIAQTVHWRYGLREFWLYQYSDWRGSYEELCWSPASLCWMRRGRIHWCPLNKG